MSEDEFRNTIGDVSDAEYWTSSDRVPVRYVGIRTYASWDRLPENFHAMQSGGGGSGRR